VDYLAAKDDSMAQHHPPYLEGVILMVGLGACEGCWRGSRNLVRFWVFCDCIEEKLLSYPISHKSLATLEVADSIVISLINDLTIVTIKKTPAGQNLGVLMPCLRWGLSHSRRCNLFSPETRLIQLLFYRYFFVIRSYLTIDKVKILGSWRFNV
jgi:hypothetical protein